MGFAVVDIQMRGTGCSGGAFDFFEPLQSLDGYDIVETIARQPWVKGHKVGMMGISYGGISQLFTAQTQPPHLAAISPLSVIDATATTLYPGGILNTGFAVAWAKERQQQAQPAGTGAEGTQPYAEQRIAEGDTTCEDNQVLHGEAADLMTKIRAQQPLPAEGRRPARPGIVRAQDQRADVHGLPVGGRADRRSLPGAGRALHRHDKKWFTFTNGAHIDSLDPETLNRWYDFLELYVADQAPAENAAVIRAAAPVIYQAAMGTPAERPDHAAGGPGPAAADVRPGAGGVREGCSRCGCCSTTAPAPSPTQSQQPGDPYPAYEHSFATLPVPGHEAESWYLGAGQRAARRSAPAKRNVDSLHLRPATRCRGTDFTGSTGTGGLWGNASQWSWDWKQRDAGHRRLLRLRAPGARTSPRSVPARCSCG